MRSLIVNERLRLRAGLLIPLAVTAFVAFVGLTAFAPAGRPLSGLLCYGGMWVGPTILLWALFGHRFIWRSAVRGLPAKLARFGTLDTILDQIDRELKDPDRFFIGQASSAFLSPQPDGIFITANWLVRLCPGGSAIVHLPDLAWVYRRLVARHAVLALGRLADELTCVMRTGEVCGFETWSPRKTEEVVDALLARRPEILTGYRGECVELAADPAGLWAELQNRRTRLSELTPEQRDDWEADRWEEIQRYVLRQDRQAGPVRE